MWYDLYIMKPLEFDTKISVERTIQIPPSLATQLDRNQSVHVVLSEPLAANGHAAALMATFGSCQDDSLDDIFGDIAQKRHAGRGRPIGPA